MNDAERAIRREYGAVRGATWDALNEWAGALSDGDLLAVAKLRVPGDAGIAVDSEARRRNLAGPLAPRAR